jgi:hypothetical protein
MCKLCGQHHYRYEPHRFTDTKAKLMFESEPRWPIEDRLDLPQRYPDADDDQPVGSRSLKRYQSVQADHRRHSEGSDHSQVAPPRLREGSLDPRSSVQSASPRTQDTAHRPPATDLSAAQLDQSHDTPDIAPLPLTIDGQEVVTGERFEIPLSDEPPNTENGIYKVTNTPPTPASAGAGSIAGALASFDDTALHSLRNLVMAEWMRRERARKRAARKP